MNRKLKTKLKLAPTTSGNLKLNQNFYVIVCSRIFKKKISKIIKLKNGNVDYLVYDYQDKQHHPSASLCSYTIYLKYKDAIKALLRLKLSSLTHTVKMLEYDFESLLSLL